MKKLYCLFLVVLLSFMVKEAVSQTSVHITGDTSFYHPYSCQRTVQLYHYIYGTTTGYNHLTDSVRIKLFFGDGTDTTYKCPIEPNNSFYINLIKTHTYQDTGVYNAKIKVIGIDNKADSIIYDNYIVGDVCESIAGKVYTDNDNNCIFNTGDNTFYQAEVLLWYGNQVIAQTWAASYNGGNYSVSLPKGFHYRVTINNNFNGLFCPSFYDIPATPAANKDFGYTCSGTQYDLTGSFGAWGNFTPNGLSHVFCWAINQSCLSVTGKLKLKFDNTKMSFSSASGSYVLSGDTVIWSFTNLANYFTSGNYLDPVVQFTTLPSVTIGDTLKFKMIETPYSNDLNPVNNIQTLFRIAGTSYDPNDKAVLPQGKGVEGFIDKNQNMIYTIRFQNTGTATAEKIYIIDTIDSNLDLNTFTLLNHSHYPEIIFMNGGVIKFNYRYIYLPDSHSSPNGSQGFVQFALRQKANLPELTQIKNTSYIYFDYNAPVKTNTVLNTIKYMGVGVNENEVRNENYTLYPNPNSGIFNLQFENLTGKALIEVYNITGQLVFSEVLNNSIIKTIDLSKQSKGIYLVKVKTDSYSSSEKIVVE
jgi:uncharacterized repeat protein (TIGR01451 family)